MFPIKKILCPTDFSEPSFLAIDAASELAGITGAEVILVHAISPLPLFPTPDAGPAFDTAGYLKEMVAHGKEQMQLLIKGRIPVKVHASALVLAGNPSEEITRSSENEGVDLIVIATHGATGWKRFVFGSVTESVVRTSTCPVLTIPAPKDKV